MSEARKKRLFGTDGIRGEANVWPMTSDVAVKVGQALGHILKSQSLPYENKGPIKVVIGKDTRLSGYMLEQALASGLNSMGVYVLLVGPLPTPGIGFLARNMRAHAGIVISASHNPYQDNGIKIFGYDGYKIEDALESEIERLVLEEDLNVLLVPSSQVGRTKRIDDAQGRYVVFAKSTFPDKYTLDGMRIVLDTANGATYKVAPRIFEELGAEVIHMGQSPNGFNINDKVGALYPSGLSDAIKQYRADVGIALDGDGDRLVLVDEKGQVMNGDHILGVCALHMKARGVLKNNTLVVTQMSNYGLEQKMKENGIHVAKTNVGDKYVVEAMRQNQYNLGGEQSGHIIFLDHSTTGDGCIAALKVLEIMKETGVKLSELNKVIPDLPQILINVRVKQKRDLATLEGYSEFIKKMESELGSSGRVFIRFSGTEPVVRVLVEGPDKVQIADIASRIADYLQTQLGAFN
jgi:phosphoglucosamine mutase